MKCAVCGILLPIHKRVVITREVLNGPQVTRERVATCHSDNRDCFAVWRKRNV